MSDRLVGPAHPDGREAGPRGRPAARRPPSWPALLLLLALLGTVAAACAPDRPQGPTGGEVAPTGLTAEPPTPPSTLAVAPTLATPPASTATDEAAPTLAGTPPAEPSPSPPASPAPARTPTELTTTPTSPSPTAGTPRVEGPIIRRAEGPALERLPPPLREIADGYLRYWDVRGWAYYSLDTSRLKDVMSGAELAREEKQVRELGAKGRAARLDVDLRFVVNEATPYEALVYDEYVNRSPYLDGATKEEIPAKEPPEVTKVSFRMRKIGGVWKVVDGRHHVAAAAATATAATTPPPEPTPPAGASSTPGATPVAAPRVTATTGAPVPTAVATARPTPTPRSLLDLDIERTCFGYWPALTPAYRDFDTSRLKEVATDAALERVEREIGDLKAAGQALVPRGHATLYFVKTTSDDAVCYAELVDRSVRVDATTRQEIPAKEAWRLAKLALSLKRVGGLWKVVDTADVAAPPAAGSRAREIADAYQRYWRARSEAYLTMDPAPLGRAMAGHALVEEQEYVAEQRAAGWGFRVDVEHNVVVVRATPDEGIVFDEYLVKSPWVELATGKETPREAPSVVTRSVVLRLEDGVWKAVDASIHVDKDEEDE